MRCVNPERHELSHECNHYGENVLRVWFRLSDGCDGRMCSACVMKHGVTKWDDITEKDTEEAHDIKLLLDSLRERR